MRFDRGCAECLQNPVGKASGLFIDQESQSDALACGLACVGKYVLMVKMREDESKV